MWADHTVIAGDAAALKHWFPVWVAEHEILAYKTAAAGWTTLNDAYEKKRAAYDTYLEDVKKANEEATAMSPAKAVELVVRPHNMPTAMPPYTGLY